MKRYLQINPSDNVVVALRPIAAGEVDGLRVIQDVPQGHKIALRPIKSGESIVKYGYPIGTATRDIAAGEHVHSHNVASHLRDDLAAAAFQPRAANGQHTAKLRTFRGYRRSDGSVATRNEIWIINTVGCVNRASELIAAAVSRELATAGGSIEGSIDGAFAFTHPFGCSQLGDDLINTQKVLAGLIRHPNAGAVLVLGLGCENNQLRDLLERVGSYDAGRIQFFNAQDVSDEVEEGTRVARELAEHAATAERETIDARELIVAMKCGGSDGFSGITANPLVGRVADRLCDAGGTVLLSEVPEMFGAEQVLLDRAADEATFRGTIDLVNNFRAYFRKHNEPIDENPSPGNKDGGITTLAEKSLGCVQKGGRATVTHVLGYGDRARPAAGGLALVNAPGNDGVSSTAMTIAGAHVELFTTGRGTPMGFPIPTVKIATNSGLAQRKPQWIDFNAGPIATGERDPDSLADELLDYVLDIASGRRTRNEQNGCREIAIWKDGVTL